MGDVAAASPGNADLGERLAAALCDENAGTWARLSGSDGTEVTGGASADDEKVHALEGRTHRKSLLRQSLA